eukprot:9494304-Pyramimonas_sp.AAC.1
MDLRLSIHDVRHPMPIRPSCFRVALHSFALENGRHLLSCGRGAKPVFEPNRRTNGRTDGCLSPTGGQMDGRMACFEGVVGAYLPAMSVAENFPPRSADLSAPA